MSKRKLNIMLILPTIFEPDMPARPAVTEIYGKYMVSFGHNITWICPSKKKNNRVFNKEKYNQVTLYNFTMSHSASSNLISKILDFITYYLREYQLIGKILKKEKYDIIQVRNDVFSALIAIYFKNKYNIPFVFQYSFPKSISISNKINVYRCFGIFQNYVQISVLKKADLILPISKWMESKLVEEGIPMSKMMTLPMGVNPESFSFNKTDRKIRDKYCLNNSPVLLYVGSMDKLRSLNVIIYSFLRVLTYNPKTYLLMVGNGSDKHNLEKLSADLGINKNVIFTDQVSYFDVPYYISAANVCLSPISPIDTYKVSSPTKLFEYMVMCKAVVANEEIPEQKEVVEKAECGVLVKFESESFAEGIIHILSNPELAEDMGQRGYKWVVKNRSYESMAHEVENKYFELLKLYGEF